jgi:hypothetical protein
MTGQFDLMKAPKWLEIAEQWTGDSLSFVSPVAIGLSRFAVHSLAKRINAPIRWLTYRVGAILRDP